MVRKESKFIVPVSPGIHARIATKLANTANRFKSEILVGGKDGGLKDAKSVLGWLSLAAGEGADLKVLVYGSDAEQAMKEISTIFESSFEEQEMYLCERSR